MQQRTSKLLSGLAALLICWSGYPQARAEGRAAFIIRYVSPLPDSRYVLPGTNIIIRTDRAIGTREATGLVGRVVGSQSGIHACTVRVSDDGRTATFQPETPFTGAEQVTVQVDTSAAQWGGRARAAQFTFTIAGRRPDLAALRAQLRGSDFPPAVSLQRTAGTNHVPRTSQPAIVPDIVVTTSSPTSSGYLFLAPLIWSVTSIPALLILQNDGTPLFARDLPANGYDFKLQPNGMMTYYDDGSEAFLVMDPSFTVDDTIRCGNGYGTDPHELRILPNGHALLLGEDPETVDMSQVVPGGYAYAEVIGYVIQELDQSKNVVFQWRSWDHYRITDAMNISFTSTTIDYVHGNAIDMDTDGNLIFSSRHLNEITKINRETGDIIWRFGGMNNQFRFLNDPVGFSYQHAVRRIANGNITLFDNGNFHVPPYSRALEYALDEETKTATLVWQYRNTPDVFGFAMGFVERMPNGNTLIGWGAGNPTVTEVTAGGNKVFEMSFDEGVYSYRAYRLDWQPLATSVPPGSAPATTALDQNYPNPFNPSTTIQYSIARPSHVRLELYNLLGERVSTLVDREQGAGSYAEHLDGTRLSSGVYIYRLTAGGFTDARRMVLLK